MDVALTKLYELRDKVTSLSEDDKAFVLETIGRHESGKLRLNPLNRQEILKIDVLHNSTRGIKVPCAHLITAPVFEKGDETDERECSQCGHRFKIR